MSMLNIDMKKTMSITIAILLTLSILGLAVPAMLTANAATTGQITLSDTVISGERVIKITITDADIAAPDADMPMRRRVLQPCEPCFTGWALPGE